MFKKGDNSWNKELKGLEFKKRMLTEETVLRRVKNMV